MNNYPYIYKGTNTNTGEFYIGYRESNQHSSEQDLGINYFTSSDLINKENFNHFDWIILAEYFIDTPDMTSGTAAYWEEQRMIKSNIDNPLCLNKHYIDPDTKQKKFSVAGTKQPNTSMKLKGNKNGVGRKNAAEFIENMKGNSYAKGYSFTDEQRAARSKLMTGRKPSQNSIESTIARCKKPIVAGGIEFDSSKAASEYYQLSAGGVKTRLNSKHWPDWYRVN